MVLYFGICFGFSVGFASFFVEGSSRLQVRKDWLKGNGIESILSDTGLGN